MKLRDEVPVGQALDGGLRASWKDLKIMHHWSFYFIDFLAGGRHLFRETGRNSR